MGFNMGLILVILICTNGIWAQNPDKIPFILTDYNNISIPVIINDKDSLYFMLHTGSSGIDITKSGVERTTTILFKDAVSNVESWGGSGNVSRISYGNKISIGKRIFLNQEIWEDENSGQNTSGKFGISLFKDKIIEIDFEDSILLLHHKMPIYKRKFAKMRFVSQNELIFIPVEISFSKHKIVHYFMWHSGYAGALLVDDSLSSVYNLKETISVIKESKLSDAFGNILKTYYGILPLCIFGRDSLKSIPIGFFGGSIRRQKISVMGGDFIKRFNWIIDFKRECIYIRKNNLFFQGYKSL
jgi:hypothetical protein